ncbi:MAG: DUF4392 domain-containing protein [Desulfobacterales bacterium]|nr:DUF4392 domain-containing protein [Desulfobacterales bacterium]
MGENERLTKIGDALDRLITVDVKARGSIPILYNFAREKFNEPLTMLAAKRLKERVTKRSVVLIATGWPDRPWINPAIAELDGPPGAAALARGLHIGLNAVPIVLIEQQLTEAMKACLTGAGFRIMEAPEAVAAISSPSPIHGCAVLPFPVDRQKAQERAFELIETFSPTAVIAIEKGGMNEKGVIHNSRGVDTTADMAKVDMLMEAAAAKNILTIGIGDGGNEIGMGTIGEVIRKHIPYGAKCQCPCGGGLAPATVTDAVVPATVSNWGAYGILAALAVLSKSSAILHDPRVEARILRMGADAGLIDGMTGFCIPGADGMEDGMHMAMITLLSGVVEAAISPGYLSR